MTHIIISAILVVVSAIVSLVVDIRTINDNKPPRTSAWYFVIGALIYFAISLLNFLNQ